MTQSHQLVPNCVADCFNMMLFRDTHVAIEAMMALAGAFVGEQAKEEKDVADPHPLIGQMRLGCITLPKDALAIDEHWILVAKVIAPYTPSR